MLSFRLSIHPTKKVIDPKIVNNRVANLTDVAYFLIKDNTFDEIIKKYNAYLI